MHFSRFCPHLLPQVMSLSLHHYETPAILLSGSDLFVWPLSSSRYKKVISRHGASDVFNLAYVPEAGLSGPGVPSATFSRLHFHRVSPMNLLWLRSESHVHRPCNTPAGLLKNLFRETRERWWSWERQMDTLRRKLKAKGLFGDVDAV